MERKNFNWRTNLQSAMAPKFDSFGGGNLAQAILCSRARLSLFLEQGERREIFRQLKTIHTVEIAARRAEVLCKRDMLCAFFFNPIYFCFFKTKVVRQFI